MKRSSTLKELIHRMLQRESSSAFIFDTRRFQNSRSIINFAQSDSAIASERERGSEWRAGVDSLIGALARTSVDKANDRADERSVAPANGPRATFLTSPLHPKLPPCTAPVLVCIADRGTEYKCTRAIWRDVQRPTKVTRDVKSAYRLLASPLSASCSFSFGALNRPEAPLGSFDRDRTRRGSYDPSIEIRKIPAQSVRKRISLDWRFIRNFMKVSLVSN